MNSTQQLPMTNESQQAKDEKPLLTIAIPTYNRAKYLRELLSSLFDQLVVQTAVELIVSDNASSDETPSVIDEFEKRGLKLRRLCNDVNIGPDANFQQCFEKACGKYVWIFGDDDIIVPGGIDRILKLLETGDYALTYVSQYWFRHNYAAEETSDRFGRFAQVFPGGLQFARKAGAMIGFISGMIVNKDIYSTILHQSLTDYDGTNLIQLGWVCPLLACDSKYLFVWERLVAARGGNTSGWGICQVFGANFKQFTDVALGYRRDIARALQTSTLQRWFPDMIMEVRRGTGSKLETENMRGILEPIYKTRWSYWAYVFPLMVLPLALAGVWYSMILFLRRLRMLLSVIRDNIFTRETFVMKPG
jgi:abequosyltransferase